MTDKTFDIIVAGCGLAGLTQSLLLAQEGFHIACVGMEPPTSDTRTTAISYGSHLILKQAGIWGDVLTSACPIEDIQILDGNSSVLLGFNSKQDQSAPAFGWIIENAVLFKALFNAVNKIKNITLILNQKITDLSYTDDIVTAYLKDKQIEAKLIIGADGRQSFVREVNNIPSKKWDYNQTAIVCFITHKNAHDNIAIEHFYSSGPFAVLPMNDKKGKPQSSIVWTVERGDAPSLISNPDTLKTAIEERLPAFYGACDTPTDIQTYPLTFNHAYSYYKPRTALIADAAHGIHPIAGQGLNIGLQDVKELTTLLVSIKEKDIGLEIKEKDIGLEKNLKPYEQKRLPENMKTAAATDTLNHLFSNDNAVISLVRKKGLKLVQKIRPAKRFFSKTAMGLQEKKSR